DERALAAEHVAPRPDRDPRQRRLGERLLPPEDALGRQRPVDDLRRGPPRPELPRRLPRVRRRGPHDRPAIAPGDEEEPPPRRGRAVVGRDERAPLDRVARGPEHAEPPRERLAL